MTFELLPRLISTKFLELGLFINKKTPRSMIRCLRNLNFQALTTKIVKNTAY